MAALSLEMYISSIREYVSGSPPAIQFQKRRISVAAAAAVKEGEVVIRRRRALRRVDRELENGNYTAALSLVKQLKAHPAGLLRGFGAAAGMVGRSALSLNELKLTGEIEVSSLQLVVDAILHSIKSSLEFQMQEEAEEQETKLSQQDSGLVMDAESSNSIHEDRLMCIQHEAGHFLVGYMLGVLPRRYKIPSMDDLLLDNFARGKVEFVGFEFLRDVSLDTMVKKTSYKGKLNKEILKKFSCVILGGLTAEHLIFGYSELLHSDVEKLDRVFKWLDFKEKEADSVTRQAAEAATLILYCYSDAQSKLAEAMASGRSIGFCIDTIERTLNFNHSSSIF